MEILPFGTGGDCMSVALGCTCKHLMLHPPLLARANHVAAKKIAAKKTHKTFGMCNESKLDQDTDIYHQLYGEYENADFSQHMSEAYDIDNLYAQRQLEQQP